MASPKVHPAAWVWALALAGCLTGCGTSRTTVPMTLKPYVYKPVTAPAKAAIEVAPVKDSRAVKDGLTLAVEVDRDGRYLSEDYVTKEPFADIFRDALNFTLQRNGFETTNATQYVLESNLAGLYYEKHSGEGLPWKVLTTISTEFELKDKATGQSVWKTKYEADDVTETGWVTGNFLARACSRAAEEVVRQLIADPKFRAYFETQGTNAP